MQCASCAAQNPEGKRFCGECGAPLRPAAPVAELRQITVMFCDLVGSTALAEQLDPEDLRDILHEFQNRCAEAIRSYEGHIARLSGDGERVYYLLRKNTSSVSELWSTELGSGLFSPALPGGLSASIGDEAHPPRLRP